MNNIIEVAKNFDESKIEETKMIINQIPEFLNIAREGASQLSKSYDNVLEIDSASLNKVNASYDLLINSLNDNLIDEELTFDQKIEIVRLMRDIIHDQEDFNNSQMEKRHELYKQIAGGVLTAAVSIIGIISNVSRNKPVDTTKLIDTNHS